MNKLEVVILVITPVTCFWLGFWLGHWDRKCDTRLLLERIAMLEVALGWRKECDKSP